MKYDSLEQFFPKHLSCKMCFGKNYSSFIDFTRNYERMSGFLSPAVGGTVNIQCTHTFHLMDNLSIKQFV